jgi:cation diffusion facilitator family transporter
MKLLIDGKQMPGALSAKKLAAMSLGLNVLLSAAKFLLYLYTSSSALLAESVHSLTDSVGGVLILAGIYLSEKKTSRFPWGLYKVENIAATASAISIFLSAYEIIKVIYTPSAAAMKNLDFGIAMLFVMALPVFLFQRYEKKKAKLINSPSLLADSEGWKMDLLPLAIVAAGLVGARLSYTAMDRIAAFLIVIIIINAGYKILKDAMKSLLDASVDMDTLTKVYEIVRTFPDVREVISLNARNSGRFIFVEAYLSLAVKKLKAASHIGDQIEASIKARIPFVERAIVRFESVKKDYRRCAAPLATREGEISNHFGSAPFIALWDERVPDGTLLSSETLENTFQHVEKGKGIGMAQFLVDRDIDVIYTKESFGGKGPAYIFSNAEVEVKITQANNLKELMGPPKKDEAREKSLCSS